MLLERGARGGDAADPRRLERCPGADGIACDLPGSLSNSRSAVCVRLGDGGEVLLFLRVFGSRSEGLCLRFVDREIFGDRDLERPRRLLEALEGVPNRDGRLSGLRESLSRLRGGDNGRRDSELEVTSISRRRLSSTRPLPLSSVRPGLRWDFLCRGGDTLRRRRSIGSADRERLGRGDPPPRRWLPLVCSRLWRSSGLLPRGLRDRTS